MLYVLYVYAVDAASGRAHASVCDRAHNNTIFVCVYYYCFAVTRAYNARDIIISVYAGKVEE